MKGNKRRNKLGKKLLVHALDGFYAFEDDEIEDAIEFAINKFKGRIDWRKQTRLWLWSKEHLRNKICQVAWDMFGDQ
jgi:hypothetical protein